MSGDRTLWLSRDELCKYIIAVWSGPPNWIEEDGSFDSADASAPLVLLGVEAATEAFGVELGAGEAVQLRLNIDILQRIKGAAE